MGEKETWRKNKGICNSDGTFNLSARLWLHCIKLHFYAFLTHVVLGELSFSMELLLTYSTQDNKKAYLLRTTNLYHSG